MIQHQPQGRARVAWRDRFALWNHGFKRHLGHWRWINGGYDYTLLHLPGESVPWLLEYRQVFPLHAADPYRRRSLGPGGLVYLASVEQVISWIEGSHR